MTPGPVCPDLQPGDDPLIEPIFTAILSYLCLQPGHRETYLGNVTMIRQQQLELDLPDLMKVDMKVWHGEQTPE